VFTLAISRYRIASVLSPVPGVRIFRLEPVAGKVSSYAPGQFMFLHILDDAGASVIKRPYSIASSPSAPYLEFAIDLVGGQMTSRLEKMKAGDVLGVEGPAGHMTFKGEAMAAFVAGGTGVSPFMSMLRHISESGLKGSFVLFYSARTRERVLYHDEMMELQRRNRGIKVVITLTREAPERWSGECGRISDAMIQKHLRKAGDYDWWVCGPPEMVKAMRVCLAALGADPKRMRMEGWG
jgi:ferredoxin-NADP reductase